MTRRGLYLATMLLWAGTAAGQPAGSAIEQSGLLGKVEGAALVLDPAKRPASFREAPALDALVKAGKLPPVADRLPENPLMIQPLRAIGRYGGTWRRAFMGPGDSENGNRVLASDKLIFWDHTGTRMVPGVAQSWAQSEDGKRLTLSLRKGMRWSDGAPFTADDFVFWFNDIYGNPDLVPNPIGEMSIRGKPGRLVKVDETTVAFEFDEPYFLFLTIMAGDTLIGGGQSRSQSAGMLYGAYAPAHYLKQFLPKYSSLDQANARARAEGYQNWVQLVQFKTDWRLNRDLPTLAPWHMTQPINSPVMVLERNPYYWAVDTDGNQLPYIDRVQFTLAENIEVVNLRGMAGEYDYQERNIDLAKLPLLLEHRQGSGYKVHLDVGVNGADTALHVNIGFRADPEISRWLTNADFRRALSLGINRDQLNEAFWLGLGVPGSVAPGAVSPYSPGPEWQTRWSTYDPDQANQILNRLGLTKRNGEGFRLRLDNGEPLRIELQTTAALLPWPQEAEMVAQQWRKIGIYADVKNLERSLLETRFRANQSQITVFSNIGTEMLYLYPQLAIPVDTTNAMMGVEFAAWYASNGARGRKPEDPNLLRIFDLYRAAGSLSPQDAIRSAQEIWRIIVEQQFSIGVVGQSPALFGVRIVSDKLRNVPERVCLQQQCRAPAIAHPETWYFE